MYTLLDRFFYEYTLSHPELLTKTKAFKWPYAPETLEGHLNNESTIQSERDFEYLKGELEFLNRYDQQGLDHDEELSRGTFEFIMDVSILDRWIYKNVKYPIDHVSGIQVQLPLFMINSHTIDNVNQAYNYISRLEEIQDKVAELISGKPLFPTTREDQLTAKGILFRRPFESLEESIHHLNINDGQALPPKSTLKQISRQLESFLAVPLNDNILYVDFIQKLEKLDDENVKGQFPELKYRAKKAIEGAVIPSFDALKRTIDELELQAEEEITLMRFGKEGDNYYRHLLQYHLGLNKEEIEVEYRPRNLNYLAKKMVREEKQKLNNLLDSLEIPKGSLQDRFYHYSRKYPLDKTRNSIVSFLEEYNKSPRMMNDKVQINVNYFPEYIKNVSYEPFYFEGSFDNSRQGNVYINQHLSDYEEYMMGPYAIATYAAHEWSNRRILNNKLPLFRRELKLPYCLEFWKNIYLTTYYSKTSQEERVLYYFWRLNNALLMWCDLGVHHFLWTKNEALMYVSENSALNLVDAERVVEECTALPGKYSASGFGMFLSDKYYKNKGLSIDSQEGRSRLKSLFSEGSLTLSSFDTMLYGKKL
ncbi:hypothetical protein NH26_09065 [Flammeovirga pacifica]|uniref:DUF885 domain-containing protein n=2 Tax=Flammeovirga pacifica TaxID=915059 RepID=A0A1S1Z070_FLAPC|nr:hypothetical protein NH26_09065 [Flammeovirga pacifica]